MPDTRTREDLARVDAEFRARAIELSAPPTRFYLNLSDRCPLRCRHCITHAPERTSSGTAGVMQPAVVQALRPHLAHAAYVGFVHAGEPLTAPALVPVLEALRDARAGEPSVVHLLTNGLVLDESRFAELVELGVCSWSFSVDGMSPRTHDALRVGSHIGELLATIDAVTRLARRRYPGTRLGIAWTVTRSNLEELPELVRFAAGVGLDWLKLEEMWPTNDVAASEAAVDREKLAAAIASTSLLAAQRELPLLLHLEDRQVFKCRLDEDAEVARFSRLDDFVNRMEINPCRLPYELCCVEPDGTLKPVSFHCPPAGHLLADGLTKVWNSRRFKLAREGAVFKRLCNATGACTCLPDPGPALG